jgi:hypothetical protein
MPLPLAERAAAPVATGRAANNPSDREELFDIRASGLMKAAVH